MLEQTLKNWAIHYALSEKGIAATKLVDPNKDSDAEIILAILSILYVHYLHRIFFLNKKKVSQGKE